MNSKDKGIIFLVGGLGYGLIEILWRGYTHWSMVLAGGICFSMLSAIERAMNGMRYLYKCIAGSVCITAVEFVFGLLFNVVLRRNVWNYGNLKFNLFGQVCLLYSVLWGILSAACFPLCKGLFKALQNRRKVV